MYEGAGSPTPRSHSCAYQGRTHGAFPGSRPRTWHRNSARVSARTVRLPSPSLGPTSGRGSRTPRRPAPGPRGPGPAAGEGGASVGRASVGGAPRNLPCRRGLSARACERQPRSQPRPMAGSPSRAAGRRLQLPLLCLFLQGATAVLFAVFVRYNHKTDAALWHRGNHSNADNEFYFRYPSECGVRARGKQRTQALQRSSGVLGGSIWVPPCSWAAISL